MNLAEFSKSIRRFSLLMCGMICADDLGSLKESIVFVRASHRYLSRDYIAEKSTFTDHWKDCFGWITC